MVDRAFRDFKWSKSKVMPIALMTIKSILSSIHKLSPFKLITGPAYVFENYFQFYILLHQKLIWLLWETQIIPLVLSPAGKGRSPNVFISMAWNLEIWASKNSIRKNCPRASTEKVLIRYCKQLTQQEHLLWRT